MLEHRCSFGRRFLPPAYWRTTSTTGTNARPPSLSLRAGRQPPSSPPIHGYAACTSYPSYALAFARACALAPCFEVTPVSSTTVHRIDAIFQDVRFRDQVTAVTRNAAAAVTRAAARRRQIDNAGKTMRIGTHHGLTPCVTITDPWLPCVSLTCPPPHARSFATVSLPHKAPPSTTRRAHLPQRAATRQMLRYIMTGMHTSGYVDFLYLRYLPAD